MKSTFKLFITALLLAGCGPKNNDGTYINHTEGQFSIADDTLIINDTVITKKTGYQSIRNGKLMPKAYKKHVWTINSPDAPAIQIAGDRLIFGPTTYTKLP